MTIRIVPALAVAGLLAACAMPPEGTTEQDVSNFNEAVASIGCTLRGEGDFQAVELQTGLSREQVTGMAQYSLESEQSVRQEDGGLRLMVGECA